MKDMKQFLPLAGLAAAATLVFAASHEPVNPAFLQVKTVYILPMGSGLDQFLASRLTQRGVFEIVTDPKKADAIFTDRLGESFEHRMNELYPAPKPPEPPAAEEDKGNEEGKSKSGKSSAADKAEAERLGRDSSAPHTLTFGRNRGTLFLVDRQSRSVVWSLYARPKDTSPATLDRTADKIARRLQLDRNPQLKAEMQAKSSNP